MDPKNEFTTVFDGLDAPTPAEPISDVSAGDGGKGKGGGNERMRQLKIQLSEEMSKNPELVEEIHKLSGQFEVTNTFGYGAMGGIILDKDAPVVIGSDGKEKRNIAPTSQIIGYRVKNIGDKPVEVATQKWAKNDQGIWEPQDVTEVLKPGGTINLAKKFMTLFAARPEISFRFANGAMQRSGKPGKRPEDVLESYHFTFLPATGKEVNDVKNGVKINVGAEDPKTKQWSVKPEYTVNFGYLENPKSEARRTRGSGTSNKLTVQAAAAAEVRRMMAKGGFNI